MLRPNSLILVNFLEQQAVDDVLEGSRFTWPAHIGLIKWFGVIDEGELGAGLTEVARNARAFQAQREGRRVRSRNYGVAQDIIHQQLPFSELHAALWNCVMRAGGIVYQKDWMEDGFTPIIARNEQMNSLEDGPTTFSVTDFHLVRLVTQDKCQIIEQFPLGRKS